MPEIEQQIKRKIEAIGTPLKEWDVHIYRGILTGFNEAFIIDSATRDTLIAADPKSAEIIRPILRGRDIKRYSCEFANLWLICTQTGSKDGAIPPVNIENYPAVKAHLDQYYPALEKRLDRGITPYHLRSCAYMDDFSKQKIVWGEISDKPKFTIDLRGEFMAEATTFLMVGKSLLYLLGFLNSSLSEYYFSKIGTTTGVGTVRWKKFKIEQFPIPKMEPEEENAFTSIVEKVLDLSVADADFSELNRKMNSMICESFGLSKDEISFIQDSFSAPKT